MNDKMKPALIGGVILGILSAIPFVNIPNICCCAWAIVGGIIAANIYIKNSPAPGRRLRRPRHVRKSEVRTQKDELTGKRSFSSSFCVLTSSFPLPRASFRLQFVHRGGQRKSFRRCPFFCLR